VISRDLGDTDKLVRMPIGFPKDLYEWLREAAHRRRVPMSELVREALREYRTSRDPQIELWTQRDAER
jgi:metal-responsive CopG/Arc/MetJ family transcriptional regulator